MSVVCGYGNSHRVRPRVVVDESPLTPQGLCELSLPLEHQGFDWGQAQFGVVQFVGGCVSYVEKSFDASVVKPSICGAFTSACSFTAVEQLPSDIIGLPR